MASSVSAETPRRWAMSALRVRIVRADEEGHRLATRDALLFLFGWRDAAPAQLLLELDAWDTAFGAIDDLGKQLPVAAPHPVQFARPAQGRRPQPPISRATPRRA